MSIIYVCMYAWLYIFIYAQLALNEINMLVAALDTNANGRIDYQEFASFLNASTGVTLPSPEEALAEADEEEEDTDNDGDGHDGYEGVGEGGADGGESTRKKTDHRRPSKQLTSLGEKTKVKSKSSSRRLTKEHSARDLDGGFDIEISDGSVNK
jgi:hypothetical protein